MQRCCHPRTAPASHRRSPWPLAIFFSIYLPFLPPFPLSRAGSGQAALRCARAEFSFSSLFQRRVASSLLSGRCPEQLRDGPIKRSPLCPGSLRAQGVRVLLAAPAAPAGLQDVSAWQRAPVCRWHPGRVLAAFLSGGGGAVSEVYVNSCPESELDELPGCFVSLPGAVSPALPGSPGRVRDAMRDAGQGRAGAGRVLIPVGCAWQLCLRNSACF